MTEKYERGKHPNSIKNLVMVAKGEKPPAGAGQKKGNLSFKSLLKRALKTTITTDARTDLGLKPGYTVLEEVIAVLISKAKDGDVKAIKELLDRHVGKATQAVELTGKDGQALQIEHTQSLDSAYTTMKEVFDIETEPKND